MNWIAKQRVFRLIPSLENAEFVRFGLIPRNTFVNSPRVHTSRLHLWENPDVYLAGQIVGVEGYIESTAMGFCGARQIATDLLRLKEEVLSPETMCGAVIRYITKTDPDHFKLVNANFFQLDPPPRKMPRSRRKAWLAELSLAVLRKERMPADSMPVNREEQKLDLSSLQHELQVGGPPPPSGHSYEEENPGLIPL